MKRLGTALLLIAGFAPLLLATDFTSIDAVVVLISLAFPGFALLSVSDRSEGGAA